MTFKVAKSQMPAGFEVAVASHAFEMRNWRAHMARVEESKAKPDLSAIDRHVAYPRPGAHPLVEASVNEHDEADYEIVDDSPTPAQILAAKRSDLLRAVSLAEQEAIAAVVTIGKQRLFNLMESDIRNRDAELFATLAAKKRGSLLAAAANIASKIGIGSGAIDTLAEVEKQRPAADTKHLADQSERRSRIALIQRDAAQAHHDIEDLTTETVDGWTMPSFPT